MQTEEPIDIFEEFKKLNNLNNSIEIIHGLLHEPPSISNEDLTAALMNDHYHPTLLEMFFDHCTKYLITGVLREAHFVAYRLISLAQQSAQRCYTDGFLDTLREKINAETSNSRFKVTAAITSLLAYIALQELSLFLSKTASDKFKMLKAVDILSPIDIDGFSSAIRARMQAVKAQVDLRLQRESKFIGLGNGISTPKKAVYKAIITMAEQFDVSPVNEDVVNLYDGYMQHTAIEQIDSIKALQAHMRHYLAVRNQHDHRSILDCKKK